VLPQFLSRLAGLAALAFLAGPALAADFDGAYPPPRPDLEDEVVRRPPPPPPEPVFHGPRFSAGPRFDPPPADECRTFVKRRFDAYGDEVVRRVRVCDERPGFGRGPRFGPDPLAAGGYGPPHPVPPGEIPEGRWGGPRW
jgi:hypothetical protein